MQNVSRMVPIVSEFVRVITKMLRASTIFISTMCKMMASWLVLGGIKTNVSLGKPKGNISIQNKNNVNGSFDVVISNVSALMKCLLSVFRFGLMLTVKTILSGIRLLNGANGTYKVTVESSKHKDSVGKYHIHLYYVRNDGQLVGVGGTTTNVSAVKPQGKISIQNRNSETGDFDIVVSDIVSPWRSERSFLANFGQRPTVRMISSGTTQNVSRMVPIVSEFMRATITTFRANIMYISTMCKMMAGW